MSLKEKSFNSFVWTFVEQVGTGILSLFFSIILARILVPKDFGIIGMILIFNQIGNSLVISGMGTSLIRSNNNTEKDYSTVFYYNLFFSILLYVIIYTTAPLIANFYTQPILKPLIRVYSITILINALGIVQDAIFSKEFNFKILTLAKIVGLLIGGAMGIYIAINGYGVWSLVIYPIIQLSISNALIWIYSKWRPKLIFSKASFKKHFIFGYKVALSGVIETVFNNIYNVIIGKFFTPQILGYYNRADSLQSYPPNIISIAIRKVTLPFFSEIQNDNNQLKKTYSEIIRLALFTLSPIMICGIIIAKPLFEILLTAKWLPAVPYFQILCVTGLLLPLQSFNLNILHVKGRSDIILKLTMYKRFVFIFGMLFAFQFGIYGLLIWAVCSSLISFFINAFHSGKQIDYTLKTQIKDSLSIILPALIIGLLVFLSYKLFNNRTNPYVTITTTILLYLLLYFFFHKVTNSNTSRLAYKLVNKRLNN